MRRRLTAVLAADVVGYARLMGDDEDGTLASLRRLRSEVIGPVVAAKHGRIVKSMGDGWIVTFEALTQAVECAMQIQDRLKIDGSMQLREGVHLGDVAEVDEDVFGIGVNVAARLQQLAEPGALAISNTARDLLDGTLRPSFDSAGLRELKNIAEPVPVWVRGGEVAGGKAAMESSGLPRLAVMPVTTNDARDEVRDLAMALTGDLAAHLNALRYLTTRATTDPDDGMYRLTSALRTQGDRVRLEAQLVSPDGAIVLSEKFDGDLSGTFDWQDVTGLKLAQTVLDRLMAHEVAAFAHMKDDDCTAEQLLLRMMVLGATDGPGIGMMTDLMSLAISKKPDWGPAYAYAVALAVTAMSTGSRDHVARHLGSLAEWSRKVDELEPAFSHARIVLAFGQLVQTGNREQACKDVRMVMRNLPFDPEALHFAAWVYNFSGEAEEALACLDQAERSIIPPYAAASVINARAMAMMLLGAHDEAVRHAGRAAEISPYDMGAHLIPAASFAQAGDMDAARAALDRALALSPNYSLRQSGWRPELAFPPRIAAYFEGLRKAGLPE